MEELSVLRRWWVGNEATGESQLEDSEVGRSIPDANPGRVTVDVDCMTIRGFEEAEREQPD